MDLTCFDQKLCLSKFEFLGKLGYFCTFIVDLQKAGMSFLHQIPDQAFISL